MTPSYAPTSFPGRLSILQLHEPWPQAREPPYLRTSSPVDTVTHLAKLRPMPSKSVAQVNLVPLPSRSRCHLFQRCIVRFANYAIPRGLRDALMVRGVNLHGGGDPILYLITPWTASPNSVPPRTHFGRNSLRDKPRLNVNEPPHCVVIHQGFEPD